MASRRSNVYHVTVAVMGEYHSYKEENVGKSGQDTGGQGGEGDTEEAGKPQLLCKEGFGG